MLVEVFTCVNVWGKICDFSILCPCSNKVSYIDNTNLFQLMKDLLDTEIQKKKHTHHHTLRHYHKKYSLLSDNDDWCPSKKAKQMVVGSINQLVGWGSTESPHWSSYRPNVSISKSFILGTISYTTSAALAETKGWTCYKTTKAIGCW